MSEQLMSSNAINSRKSFASESMSDKERKNQKIKNYIENLHEEQKLKFWIKTLFGAYSTLPEIIKTIDKIIELQASSVSFVSDIYNKEGSAFDQMEKVINLSERKNNLLNIYLMVKNLYQSLSAESVEIIEKKYLYGYSVDDLARDLGVSSRTIYRKVDKIVDDVFNFCRKKNWSLKFIESQLKDEGWIKERYIKIVTEYFKNNNYTESYSMSSSGL